MSELVLPFDLETDLERQICRDPEWVEGARWGIPRPGHPEGTVLLHIHEVLQNINRIATSPDERASLRLIALVHDTFKYQVDMTMPRSGPNHHAARARAFASRYISADIVLDIIELHDEAYNAWQMGGRKGRWAKAEARGAELLHRLGPNVDLYLRFFTADNLTGNKTPESVDWFRMLAGR